MPLTAEIDTTLRLCAEFLHPTTEPWWIIGSTAVALHGADPGPINDIDILVSHKDAEMLAERWQCSDQSDSNSNRFRSCLLLQPELNSFPVQVMAGLEFRNGGIWQALTPKTRQKIRHRRTSLFVPERPELIQMLLGFGRKKDIQRAKLLR